MSMAAACLSTNALYSARSMRPLLSASAGIWSLIVAVGLGPAFMLVTPRFTSSMVTTAYRSVWLIRPSWLASSAANHDRVWTPNAAVFDAAEVVVDPLLLALLELLLEPPHAAPTTSTPAAMTK